MSMSKMAITIIPLVDVFEELGVGDLLERALEDAGLQLS